MEEICTVYVISLNKYKSVAKRVGCKLRLFLSLHWWVEAGCMEQAFHTHTHTHTHTQSTEKDSSRNGWIAGNSGVRVQEHTAVINQLPRAFSLTSSRGCTSQTDLKSFRKVIEEAAAAVNFTKFVLT
jgi:hypothetical protein